MSRENISQEAFEKTDFTIAGIAAVEPGKIAATRP